MAFNEEVLYGEVDRQLAEVRAACDGLAMRSGLLVAASTVAATILGPRIQVGRGQSLLVATAIAFGLAVIAAAVTLMPWLKVGPLATSLSSWMSKATSRTSASLYDSKLVILTANLNRLLAMRIFFSIQAITTLMAVGLALSYSAWR